ncbi:hypothetical protein HYDPIDRAFT_164006 [Hydnomerulius pinastri MD-312]|nr:hypothetical protein HYDPIDRAFT_164006 [Hydnomerulius pinastri MD-312]
MVNSDVENCGAQATDWALLVLNIISTYVTWWAVNIPTLFREGWRAYIDDVAWECLRIHMPGCAGVVAVSSHDHVYWQSHYHSGVTKRMTKSKLAVAWITDSFILATSVVSIYRLCQALRSTQFDLSGVGTVAYMYPSLPVALISICIAIAAHFRLSAGYTYLFTFTAILVVGAAMALPIYFSDVTHTNTWIASFIFYLYMALPLALLDTRRGRLAMASIALAVLARTGGLTIGALSPDVYFPYCALRGPAFAGPVLSLGILAGLLAVYGFIRSRVRQASEAQAEQVAMAETEKRKV